LGKGKAGWDVGWNGMRKFRTTKAVWQHGAHRAGQDQRPHIAHIMGS
jgi:hypothetical protein